MGQVIPSVGESKWDTCLDTKANVGSEAGTGQERQAVGVAAGYAMGPDRHEVEFGTYFQFDGKTLKFFNWGSDGFVICLWLGREGAVSRYEKSKVCKTIYEIRRP